MNDINMDEKIRLRRKNALPALIVAGAIFLISWKFLGFGAIAIIALIFFLMIGWYFLTIGEKIKRWHNEEVAAMRDTAIPVSATATHQSSTPAEFGKFLLDEDSEQWLAYPKSGNEIPVFAISADWDEADEVVDPDPNLMDSALLISRNADKFEEKIRSFLANEAARQELHEFEAEITTLQVGRISFLWSKKPKEGVIHFVPKSSGKAWMCSLLDGEAVSGTLRFDT